MRTRRGMPDQLMRPCMVAFVLVSLSVIQPHTSKPSRLPDRRHQNRLPDCSKHAFPVRLIAQDLSASFPCHASQRMYARLSNRIQHTVRWLCPAYEILANLDQAWQGTALLEGSMCQATIQQTPNGCSGLMRTYSLASHGFKDLI